MGNGGCSGNVGIGAICLMLNSLAYMSFKGMGNGGSCSEMYLVFGLWWLFCLFSWLFARLGEKDLLKFMWAT
jgi:hypothetical protein